MPKAPEENRIHKLPENISPELGEVIKWMTWCNLIAFYEPELRQLTHGVQYRQLGLTSCQIRRFINDGVLEFIHSPTTWRGRRCWYRLTPKARETLEAQRFIHENP
jgi:hypothetical protein